MYFMKSLLATLFEFYLTLGIILNYITSLIAVAECYQNFENIEHLITLLNAVVEIYRASFSRDLEHSKLKKYLWVDKF